MNDNVFKTLELHPKKIYDDTIIQRDNQIKIMMENEDIKLPNQSSIPQRPRLSGK